MTTMVSNWLQSIARSVRERTRPRSSFGGDRNDPVAIYTAANAIDADMVRALLESEGIPAFPGGTALNDVYGIQVGRLAEVKVYVVKALAPRATQIIEERHLRGEVELAEDEFVVGVDEAWEGDEDEDEGAFSSDV